MDWQQISFEVQKSEVDLISEVLVGLGSLSITFKDAQDNDIYEPPVGACLLYTSPSPRDRTRSRMPSSA